MNRKEALDFLDLQEDSGTEIIRQRLAEYQAQFEKIIEESKSDFLRRVNGRKLEKILQIKRSFADWNISDVASKTNEPIESEHILILPEEDEEIPIDQTIILSYASKSDSIKKQKVLPPGWLVKHTEDKPMVVFTVTEGENYIGRKTNLSLSPFIVIDDDNYLSRVHALVSVEGDQDNWSFYLSDAGAIKDERPSKNGTYLNGNSVRVHEKEKLQDGDTIQVGLTKLVLRFNKEDQSIGKIMEEVSLCEHIPTVVLE